MFIAFMKKNFDQADSVMEQLKELHDTEVLVMDLFHYRKIQDYILIRDTMSSCGLQIPEYLKAEGLGEGFLAIGAPESHLSFLVSNLRKTDIPFKRTSKASTLDVSLIV